MIVLRALFLASVSILMVGCAASAQHIPLDSDLFARPSKPAKLRPGDSLVSDDARLRSQIGHKNDEIKKLQRILKASTGN